MAHEGVEVPARIRDQAELEAVPAQLGEHGEDVLVQLEVLRMQPAVRDLLGKGAHVLTGATHPAHDVLREADPDLGVVLELGMVLQVLDGGDPGVVVALSVENEPEAVPGGAVALRTEQRPRLRQREVDVEEDGLERRAGRAYTSAGHL
jgi:hypothetical protein